MSESPFPLRRGMHKPLEDAANAILKESLKGVTKHSEKSDILTPWKEQERLRREVYTGTGVADASIRRGVFHRSANPARPDLNSRDGITRARRTDSLASFVSSGETGTDSAGEDFE